jgi:hypothetical protein
MVTRRSETMAKKKVTKSISSRFQMPVSAISRPASGGAAMVVAAFPISSMPSARPRSSAGTSVVMAATSAGHWKVLKIELQATTM